MPRPAMITKANDMDRALASAAPSGRRLRPLARLLTLLALRRARRQLAMLEGHRLRDIGLSRDEALAEAHRPLWDAPATWLR
jgi:uncharacterized protein YjiS (DUF1127 family)